MHVTVELFSIPYLQLSSLLYEEQAVKLTQLVPFDVHEAFSV